MSDTVQIAMIAAFGSIVTSVLSIVVLILVNMALTKTRETHDLVNSRMTEFQKTLELSAEARIGQAKSEGVLAGEQAQRDRAGPPQP